MEMGTGKTLTTIAIIGASKKEKKVERVLIVCPSSVIKVWDEELKDTADYEYNIELLIGSKKQRIDNLNNLNKKDGLKIAVINYESTWRLIDQLVDFKPDMVIADESQRIKNPNSKQSKALHKLGKIAKYKLILTGTPILNTPIDIFSQYKFLNSDIYGDSFFRFKNKYAIMGGYGNYQIIGYRNKEELKEKMHDVAFRITKEEAIDLPEQIDIKRYVELDTDTRNIYEQLLGNYIAQVEEGVITVDNILTKILRLSQITGGFITDDDSNIKQIGKEKLEELENIIDEIVIEQNKKIVIFAKFIPEIQAIEKLLQDKKLQYSKITGDVPLHKRGDMVLDFQENENVKVFLAQIKTAGLGITLTKADTTVFYSLDYSYEAYTQSKSRTHRIGQQNKCTYIHLIAKDTIDEKILKAVKKKGSIAKSLLEDIRKDGIL